MHTSTPLMDAHVQMSLEMFDLSMFVGGDQSTVAMKNLKVQMCSVRRKVRSE
jgi:hypothetical protein